MSDTCETGCPGVNFEPSWLPAAQPALGTLFCMNYEDVIHKASLFRHRLSNTRF